MPGASPFQCRRGREAGGVGRNAALDVGRQVAVRLDPKHVELDEKAKKEIARDPAAYRASLEASLAALRETEWTSEGLERRLRAVAEQRGVPAGSVFQPIRIALTGSTVSEPVNELLHVVGKEAALKRLEDAVQRTAVPT